MKSKPQIYLIISPPLAESALPGVVFEDDQIHRINEVAPGFIREIAEEIPIPPENVIDTRSRFAKVKDLKSVFYEGLHPVDEGYDIIAQSVFEDVFNKNKGK